MKSVAIAIAVVTLALACGSCQSTAARRVPASDRLGSALDQVRSYILAQRKDAGYWSAPFTSDPTSDAIAMALGQKLDGKKKPDPKNQKMPVALRDSYAQSIAERLLPSGEGWSAYPGGPVDFNVTSITLICLKSTGIGKNDARFATAWKWYESQGGLRSLQLYATLLLAPLGLVPPARAPSLTPKIFGAPIFPFHLNRTGFLRGLVVPSIGINYLSGLPKDSLRNYAKSFDQWRSMTPEILDLKFDLDPNTPAFKDGSRRCVVPEKDVDGYFAKVAQNPKKYDTCVFYPQGYGPNFKARMIRFFREPLTEKMASIMDFIIDHTTPGTKVFWAEQALILETQLLNPGAGFYTMGFNLTGIRMLQEAQKTGLGNFQTQIDQAWDAVQKMRTQNQDGRLIQQWVLTGIWDTASTMMAFEPLRGTPWALSDADAAKTVDWLEAHAVKSADSTGVAMRGWSFDETDFTMPDVDDTALALAALSVYEGGASSTSASAAPSASKDAMISEASAWLRPRQNSDGGFPAWATSMSRLVVSELGGTEGMMSTLADLSQPDVTGRVLFSFDRASKALSPDTKEAKDASTMISASQKDACAYVNKGMDEMKDRPLRLSAGNWMVNYVYSAASVLTGLATVGCEPARQADMANFIMSTQQRSSGNGSSNGGWGEGPQGYATASYVAAPPTTMQSAVAIAGLIAYYEALTQTPHATIPPALVQSIEDGISFLIENTQGGTHPVDSAFDGVLIRGGTYGRYELAPAYTALYALGRWQHLRPSNLGN